MEVLMKFRKLMLLGGMLASASICAAAANTPQAFMAGLFTHTDGDEATAVKPFTEIKAFLQTQNTQTYLTSLNPAEANAYDGKSLVRTAVLNSMVKATQLAVSSLVADTSAAEIDAAIAGKDVSRLNAYTPARHADLDDNVGNEDKYTKFVKVKLLEIADVLPEADKTVFIAGLQAATDAKADKTVGFWVTYRNIKNSFATIFTGGVKRLISNAWNGFTTAVNSVFGLARATLGAAQPPVRHEAVAAADLDV